MFGMKITAMDREDDQFYINSKKLMDIKPKAFFLFMLSKFNERFYLLLRVI